MQDKSFYLLGADSEGEIDDWIRTLKKVVQSNENNNCDSSDKMKCKIFVLFCCGVYHRVVLLVKRSSRNV
jgi:hypothetical protein